jgi:hypothetical protein
LNLRPRSQPSISDESRALIERMRSVLPNLTPPAGAPSVLLGQPENYARAENSGTIAGE